MVRIPTDMESKNGKPHANGAAVVAAAYVVFAYAALLTSGETREFIVGKEALLETLGAVWFLGSAVICFISIRRARSPSKGAWFFLLLGVMFFVAFGEETSWGQHWTGFSTPTAIRELNQQEEFNLHNLALFDSRDASGERKGGMAFFLNSNRLFDYFLVSLFLVLPVLARWPHWSRSLIARMGIPNTSFAFAGPLLLNYGVTFGLLMAQDDPYTANAISEIRESANAFLCLMLCLYLIPYERRHVPEEQ